MTDDNLLKRREELKRELLSSESKTLIDIIFDWVGRLYQKISRSAETVSFWISGLVIALSSLVIAFLISILFDGFSLLKSDMFQFGIFAVVIALAFIITAKITISMVITTFHDNVIDTIEAVTDLSDLKRWFAILYNIKKPLFFSLIYTIIIGIYVPILWATTKGDVLGFGFIILLIITSFQAGLFGYYGIVFLILPPRLRKYHFKLNTANPSSSEVIDHLSDMLTNFVYMGAILAASVTLFVAYSGLLTRGITVGLLLAGWIPLTILFVWNQYALGKIITTAKWKKLNEIQSKIEELETKENIPSQETLEHLGKLMDYYDRIKATPKSALDIRAGLNFLNSLLIPLLAFVLANFDVVLSFFS